MRENIMTFNLKYDFTKKKDNSWNERVKRITKVIKDSNSLIIGTQEGLIHMLKDMDDLLEEYKRVGEGRGGEEQENEFNAIYYKINKLELEEWGQFWLSKTPSIKGSMDWDSSLPRICTWSHFKHKDEPIEFIQYNTHLDHESQKAREEGIKVILTFAKKKFKEKNIPFIIMGDFNCTDNNKVFSIIEKMKEEDFIINNCYNNINHNILCTFHEFKGGFQGDIIDYILFSKDFKIKNLEIDSRNIDGGYPSDHYPVIANLEID